jgi:hypothetical protein
MKSAMTAVGRNVFKPANAAYESEKAIMQIRIICIALAMALLFSGSGQCQSTQNSQWQKFSSVTGDFAVLLPGKPVEQKETENTETGPATSYTFTLEKAPVAYIVGYTDFPPTVGLLSPKVFLDEFRNGMLGEGSKNKLLGERDISLKNHSGRAIKFRDADGLTFTARIYLVKRRLYHLLAMTATTDEVASAGAVTKFLDSFELLDKYDAAETVTWKKFSSTQGGFAVLTPGTPTYEKRVDKDAQDAQETHVFTQFGESAMYMVMYQDFPDATSQADPEEILNHFRAGMLQGANNAQGQAPPGTQKGTGEQKDSQKVKLLDERNIALGKWPGREMRFTDPSGLIYKTRFYLVRQRMYVLTTATASERQEASSKDIEKFLGSFELLEKPSPDTATKTTRLRIIGKDHELITG